MVDKNLLDRLSAKKENKHLMGKVGVYSEIDANLHERLKQRKRINKRRRMELDSNYKLIEAAIAMLLDYLDEQETRTEKETG